MLVASGSRRRRREEYPDALKQRDSDIVLQLQPGRRIGNDARRNECYRQTDDARKERASDYDHRQEEGKGPPAVVDRGICSNSCGAAGVLALRELQLIRINRTLEVQRDTHLTLPTDTLVS